MPGAAGAHRNRADLCGARHPTPQQVPVRSPLHPATESLAGRAPDCALLLDHVPRALGNARRKDLTPHGSTVTIHSSAALTRSAFRPLDHACCCATLTARLR